jgi:protein TonB
MVEPKYPPRELSEGIEGNVTVELLVNEQGLVEKVTVLSKIGPKSFEESTLEALKQFVFQPLIENGEPVAMWVKFLVKFRIFG